MMLRTIWLSTIAVIGLNVMQTMTADAVPSWSVRVWHAGQTGISENTGITCEVKGTHRALPKFYARDPSGVACGVGS
ncbi:hypothetical protein B0G77_4734 [Paraburkholderia sp. BL10I2N1]|nr:hypothetical protein B0G77_4734 [Paraburkholderia sp. BL10I2N1]